MALASVRGTLSKAGGGMRVWLSASNTRLGIGSEQRAFVCPIQVATLKATHGQPMPRKAPFDYKKKNYNLWYQLTDKTSWRLDENSKVIVVEGSFNSQKNEFAKRLAKEFDMKYFSAIDEEDLFVDKVSGLDLRSLNHHLSKNARFYGLEDFYLEKNPTRGEICMFQIWTYRLRFMQYAEALAHMLNTGQGVVLVRSPYGDKVFAEAMRKMRYITSSGKKFYDMVHKCTICELLPPHLTIYLDKPVSEVRKSINEKGKPYEKNSKILSDEYLEAIENAYKNNVLPSLREMGEVLEVDCTDMNVNDDHDFELITEDLEQVVLEIEDTESTKFQDWNLNEDMLGYYRRFFSREDDLIPLFSLPAPLDDPELVIGDEDKLKHDQLVHSHPLRKHDPHYSPALFSMRELMFKW